MGTSGHHPVAAPGATHLVRGYPRGAAVSGEFERKTVILAFTQSVSRTRWMVIRWLIIGLVVAAFASAVAVLSNWWLARSPRMGHLSAPGSNREVREDST